MKEHPEKIRPDLEKALRAAFPEKEIIVTLDPEDSYFTGLYDKLRHRLSQIKETEIVYERDNDGVEESPFIEPSSVASAWDDEEDSFLERSGGEIEFASYHLFFLALKDDKYSYPCEAADEAEEELPEEEPEGPLGNGAEPEGPDLQEESEAEEGEEGGSAESADVGQGRPGCLLAVSLLAPVALVKFETFEAYESGSYSAPDLGSVFLKPDSSLADDVEFFRETLSPEAFQALQSVQAQILATLRSCKIETLPPQEAQKKVPWLAPGDAGTIAPDQPVTVQDAFFFLVY